MKGEKKRQLRLGYYVGLSAEVGKNGLFGDADRVNVC
jgi:hypothetical protein